MVAKQSKQLRMNFYFMGENKMNKLFFTKINLFQKYRVILTEWDNSEESQENFFKAIAELKKENIPFKIVKRRMITEYAKKLYFTYSIILDTILILGIIVAFLNLEKLIKVFS